MLQSRGVLVKVSGGQVPLDIAARLAGRTATDTGARGLTTSAACVGNEEIKIQNTGIPKI